MTLRRRGLALAGLGFVLLTGCASSSQARTAATSPEEPGTVTALAAPASPDAALNSPLLFAAPSGDGDSWKDTQGREYRMGLINTPEYNECYGSEATAKRKQLVAQGFRAQVYTTDTYGRRVSVIFLPNGTNLNVWLARYGYANDKYLATFRHEYPSLAARLDPAFAAAKAARLGLWGACSGGSSVGTTATGCHPAYLTCIPIKGDGSGRGAANDLDCSDIRKRVQLRPGGGDPYRLDADGNGWGCESYA